MIPSIWCLSRIQCLCFWLKNIAYTVLHRGIARKQRVPELKLLNTDCLIKNKQRNIINNNNKSQLDHFLLWLSWRKFDYFFFHPLEQIKGWTSFKFPLRNLVFLFVFVFHETRIFDWPEKYIVRIFLSKFNHFGHSQVWMKNNGGNSHAFPLTPGLLDSEFFHGTFAFLVSSTREFTSTSTAAWM